MDPTREEEIGRLLKDPALTLRVLEVVREDEEERRETRRRQQKAGIEAARKKNVRLGRPPKPLPDYFEDIYDKVQGGELTRTTAAKVMGISVACFRMKIKRFEQERQGLTGAAGEDGMAP